MAYRIPTLCCIVAIFRIAGCAIVAPREPTPFAKPEPDPVNGRSPIPTDAPIYDKYGAVHHNNLFGRQNTDLTDPQICGWISGIQTSPLSCPGENQACGYVVQYGTPYGVQCCPYTASAGESVQTPNWSECPWITSCVSYSAPSNSNTNAWVVTESNIISCPTQLPECRTIFLDGPGATVYQSIDCAQVATTLSALQSIISRSSVATESPSMSSSAEDGQVTAADSSPSPSPTDSTGSTNVGAIAGGAVGGVVALAIIGGLLGYLAWKKKKQRKPPMREVSQYTGSSTYRD